MSSVRLLSFSLVTDLYEEFVPTFPIKWSMKANSAVLSDFRVDFDLNFVSKMTPSHPLLRKISHSPPTLPTHPHTPLTHIARNSTYDSRSGEVTRTLWKVVDVSRCNFGTPSQICGIHLSSRNTSTPSELRSQPSIWKWSTVGWVYRVVGWVWL